MISEKIDLEIATADASQLLHWFELGKLSPEEYWDHQVLVIEKLQPKINSFISFDSAQVRKAIEAKLQYPRSQSATLQGVPVAIKDNIDVKGYNTTAGMATRKGCLADTDAFVIERLKQAGAYVAGKLNMHEAALGATNLNPHYGACQNPFRQGYTPGGSSGGSGAVVASMMTPLALGTDTMGSVRIPASYCGICGFKPSYGAVSTRNTVAVSRRLDHVGGLARSVIDLSLLFEAMQGFDKRSAESKSVIFNRKTGLNYQIGYVESIELYGVTPEIAAIYQEQLKLLASMGHRLVAVDFKDYDFAKVRRAGLLISEADMLIEHQQDWQDNRENFSSELKKMLSWADNQSASKMALAERVIDRARVKANYLFESVDILCLPTTLQTAFAFEEIAPANQGDFTSFANMSGLPALAVPTNESIDGLPTSIQFIGNVGHDYRLLQLGMDYHDEIGYGFRPSEWILELLS